MLLYNGCQWVFKIFSDYLQTIPGVLCYDSSMPVRFNNALAEWVDSLIGEHSLRQAEIKTRIPFTTLANMKSGRIPTAETIIRFASAYGENVPAALRLAGYDDIADAWEKDRTDVPDPATPSLSPRCHRHAACPLAAVRHRVPQVQQAPLQLIARVKILHLFSVISLTNPSDWDILFM
jgi:hypothetical protein